MKPKPVTTIIAILIIMAPLNSLNAQTDSLTSIDQIIGLAMENNGQLTTSQLNVDAMQLETKSAWDIGKTEFNFQYGKYNSFENDFAFDVSQQFQFPSVYAKQRNLAQQQLESSKINVVISQNDLKRDLRLLWSQLAFLHESKRLLNYQDSLYTQFLKATKLRYETEESNFLEMATAETKVMEIQNNLTLIETDITICQDRLNALINDSIQHMFHPPVLEKSEIADLYNTDLILNSPQIAWYQNQVDIANAENTVMKSKMLPDISIGYFNQSLIGTTTANGGTTTASDRFTGAQAGISIPLFFGSYKADIQKSKLQSEIAQVNADYNESLLRNTYQSHLNELLKQTNSLNYYETKAIPQAELILENANKGFTSGAINYLEFIQSESQALEIKFNYLKTLYAFNQAVIHLEYLINK